MTCFNPFQSLAHCRRFACRLAMADGDSFRVVTTGNPAASRAVLSAHALFAREDLAPDEIEMTCNPFPGIGNANQNAPLPPFDFTKL